jgi:hypothetical protein
MRQAGYRVTPAILPPVVESFRADTPSRSPWFRGRQKPPLPLLRLPKVLGPTDHDVFV